MSGFSWRLFQKPKVAHLAPIKKIGLSSPMLLPKKSPKYFKDGCHLSFNPGVPSHVAHCYPMMLRIPNKGPAKYKRQKSAMPATVRVFAIECATAPTAQRIFQSKQSGRTRCICREKPGPSLCQPAIQSRVSPSGCTARQPAISAHVHHSTSGGSMVIRMEPAASSGTALTTSKNQNAAQPPISSAMKRSVIQLNAAAMTGEKKRTPNGVSPHKLVPANWIQAIPGGLL